MWKLTKIHCENFISFKEALLAIPQSSCTLIYGINNDNASQRNNGTGKSSIIEAIAFALTGEPLRPVDKVEEIVNDCADTALIRAELYNDYDNTHFTIERWIDRKKPQIIECHKYSDDGTEIETDKTVQATVLDYNRYILEEIGLTKDDIYANFILSKSKYKSFFDASDKSKKAMINRFSGADAVDLSISALKADMEPVETDLNMAKTNKVAVESKIEVIDQQLLESDNKKAEWKAEQERRIKDMEQMIFQKRDEARQIGEKMESAVRRIDEIEILGGTIEEMEADENEGLTSAYQKIAEKLAAAKLSPVKDYVMLSESSFNVINEVKEKKILIEEKLNGFVRKYDEVKVLLDLIQEKADIAKKENAKQDEECQMDLTDIEADIAKATVDIETQRQKTMTLATESSSLDKKMRILGNILHGAVECPECHHVFFTDKDTPVEEVKSQIKTFQDALEDKAHDMKKSEERLASLLDSKASFEKERETVKGEIRQRAEGFAELEKELRKTKTSLLDVSEQVTKTKQDISACLSTMEMEQGKTENMRKRMFDEALSVIDSALDNGERYIKNMKDTKANIASSVSAYEDSIEQIKSSTQDDFVISLNNSRKKFLDELTKANMELAKIQDKYNILTVQENHFIDFRSYLANRKIDAISGVTNHFLDLIGSDLRVEMTGFKRLKSGKVRDKITVNLLRNGIPCGSYARHSGGERARINLASILGLQKLTNAAAPKGKGLDLVVIDEVLEAADSIGIETCCDALNRLKITSLLVTQNPVVDNNGNVLVIVKENGYSNITERLNN